MPRMICGSNWMMGFSHTSKAKDRLIKELFDTPKKCAAVIEVFARAGCNAFMSMTTEFAAEAVREVEQRVGEKMLWVGTPDWDKPGDFDAWKRTVEKARSLGATFCFPHQCTTDVRVDRIPRGSHGAGRRARRRGFDHALYLFRHGRFDCPVGRGSPVCRH